MGLVQLQNGAPGTRQTLEMMAALIRQGRESVKVREMAKTLVAGLKQKDYLGEIAAAHAFVRDRMRYTRDIRTVETLHTAERLLDDRQGDCDDKSVLVAALLESIGHTTRLVAIGPRRGVFAHVYAQVQHPKTPGAWITLETTEPWPVGAAAKWKTGHPARDKRLK